MPTCLPTGANLENMRKQARRLQRGVRSGDPTAIAVVEQHDPRGSTASKTFPLSAAQRAVARGYGFTSWPKLVAYLRAAGPRRSDPTVGHDPGEADADTFCRLACLTWTADDDPAHRARARRMLRDQPTLPHDNIWAAATASDPDALAWHLARDPSLADAQGGPHGWTPLLYLAYSRLDANVAEGQVVSAARSLLDAGADPNAGFLWQGLVPPFTVLTGVFGEGEQGPVRQPRHPHALALARLLLEAGADPNDGQTLYNRMFLPDDDHLDLLFEHGLGHGDGGPWRRQLSDVMATPAELLREQLVWAVERGFAERVRLVASHGADVSTPLPDGRSLADKAAAAGDGPVLQNLVDAGAPAPALDAVDNLVTAIQAGDQARADALLAAEPDLSTRARDRRPGLVQSARHPAAVHLLARNGFDLDARQDGHTALHEASFDDDLELVRALVEAGADPSIEDDEHSSTPLGWARHAHAERVAAYLTALEPPAVE